MGRLLSVHPCPICNYNIEDQLHEGGSGIAGIFLRNHYVLATCDDCHHLVSVLVPNTDQETQAALRRARNEIVQMEADAVIGDERARDLLPLFRAALDHFDGSEPAAISVCSVCGSHQLDVKRDLNGPAFDSQNAWLHCPRCEDGRLLIETSGNWD